MKYSEERYEPTDKLRDLVREDSRLIMVIGRFGLPLGFGDTTVKEACEINGVDTQTLLETANYVSSREYYPERVSLASLMEYLREAHEYFLNFKFPTIRRKLLEALDCSGGNDIALVILRFYDEYVTEVRRHMEYENDSVFVYVQNVIEGVLNRDYNIFTIASKHTSISYKLKELKDVIIQYYPQKNNYLLNDVLLDIIECEQDLDSHCNIEDRILVPAVSARETQLRRNKNAVIIDGESESSQSKAKAETLSDREKDVLVCITKGLSNKEIADELCLSVHTITTHRRNISNKLQIHTTAGLIIYAIANHLVNLQDIK